MRLNGNLSTNSDHGESRVIRQIQYSLDIATELIKGGTVIAAKIEVHFGCHPGLINRFAVPGCLGIDPQSIASCVRTAPGLQE